MDINQLCFDAQRYALKKGWEGDGAPERSFGDYIALMHSELSEALEAYRNTAYDQKPFDIWTDNGVNQKPEGVPIELADAVIRIAQFCGKHHIDLEEAIRMKMEYNAKRAKRHGGKLI